MFHERLVIKLKCPKHPRYSPRRDGEGGIKGGCLGCSCLWSALTLMEVLKRAGNNSSVVGEVKWKDLTK